MATKEDNVKLVLDLARKGKILRARDLRSVGVHPEYLRRLCAKGLLVKTGRGLYMLPDVRVTALHGLALAAKSVPKGVICLLSALRFHGIGTQSPSEVWMAIPQRAAQPRVTYPKMRYVRSSGKILTAGIDEHQIEGVPVRIYGVAKTIADCFKYRNKIGLDVAIEAVRDFRRKKKGTLDELHQAATVCRVDRVMQPYLEALT